MTGIIYKAQNKINKKVYIGQTKRSLATRKAEHKYASQSDKTNSKFYNNINYYGFDNFKWEVIEEVELKKLDEREEYWTLYYNSYKDGLNSFIGGVTATRKYAQIPVISYNIYTNEVKQFKSMIDAAEEFNVHVQLISDSCRKKISAIGNNLLFYEKDFNNENLSNKIKSFKNRQKQRNSVVWLIDPITDEIYEFENRKICSNVFGTSPSSSITGSRSSYYGFIALDKISFTEELLKLKKEKYFQSVQSNKSLKRLQENKVRDELKIAKLK